MTPGLNVHRPGGPASAWLLAAVTALSTAAWSARSRADTFTNPVVPRGGDPWAVQWGGQYFYTSTTGGDVRIGRSPWLQNLNSNSRTVWDPPAGTAYSSELWAPELHRLNGKWYLYVAADNGADANHRMFVLEGDSQDPQGSYTLKGQISIPSNRWAIDGTVFEYRDKDYFIWSGRRFSSGGNDSGSDQSLYIAEMVNPWTLSGSRVAISNPTLAWERNGHPVNEGPEILMDGDDVFLTYSASGFYTPQYAIGALKLTGTNPLQASSWTKIAQPLFDQGNGVEGTGHASFVKSPDGTEDWIVYHARVSNDAPRDVRIQRFTWGADDGLPQFGDPTPTGQETTAPSGVPLVTFIPNLSFERGGNGWLDDFRVTGRAGSVSNDDVQFSKIGGGDGPRVGYLGAGDGNAIEQDIGPIHAGTYQLSVGLAIGSDELRFALDQPASFLIRLMAVGTYPGGSANEADQTPLAETLVDSSQLNTNLFTYFDTTATVPDGPLVGDWLRVEIVSAGGSERYWDAKLDLFGLTFDTPPAAVVPEPGGAGLSLLGLGLGLKRGRRGRKSAPLRKLVRERGGFSLIDRGSLVRLYTIHRPTDRSGYCPSRSVNAHPPRVRARGTRHAPPGVEDIGP